MGRELQRRLMMATRYMGIKMETLMRCHLFRQDRCYIQEMTTHVEKMWDAPLRTAGRHAE